MHISYASAVVDTSDCSSVSLKWKNPSLSLSLPPPPLCWLGVEMWLRTKWWKFFEAFLPNFSMNIKYVRGSNMCLYIGYWQRHGGWSWGGGNLSSMSASVSTLGDSGWLIHVQSVLAGSAWIAARVELESASVLVHCRLLVFDALHLCSYPV